MEKRYVIVVQCHLVKQRCSGFLCEHAFSGRSGGFSRYPATAELRYLSMTCGGCCGRAVLRKLSNAVKMLKKKEDIAKDQVVVHLSSCICKDNYHGPPCPNKDYLTTLIVDKLGLDLIEATRISDLSEKRRADGTYSNG